MTAQRKQWAGTTPDDWEDAVSVAPYELGGPVPVFLHSGNKTPCPANPRTYTATETERAKRARNCRHEAALVLRAQQEAAKQRAEVRAAQDAVWKKGGEFVKVLQETLNTLAPGIAVTEDGTLGLYRGCQVRVSSPMYFEYLGAPHSVLSVCLPVAELADPAQYARDISRALAQSLKGVK